jgi:putative flavoprotein involved in K+ transport
MAASAERRGRRRTVSEHAAIVIGAGPAGLGAAATLHRAGIEPIVLERSTMVGARWHTYYDRLRLQSPRWLTNLPGHRFPRSAGRWPTRDAVIEYLDRYAEKHRLQVRFQATVQRIDRHPRGWRVRCPDGDLTAPVVVVATGYNNIPFIPEWDGRERFTTPLIHGSAFKNADPFAGQHVLVVGAGNSGSEIATALAEGPAAQVTLAVRTPPHVAPLQAFGVPSLLSVVLLRRLPPRAVDRILGLPIQVKVGDLRRYGFRRPALGIYSKYLADGVTPILDTGLVKMLRAGRIKVVPAVQALDRDSVHLIDGSTVAPDIVIAATGYRQGLEPLVGHLGVLGNDGRPAVIGPADHPTAPGLFFIGYAHPLSGNIRDMALDARRIARTLQKRTGQQRWRPWRREFDYRKRRSAIPNAHSSLTPPQSPAQTDETGRKRVMQPTG